MIRDVSKKTVSMLLAFVMVFGLLVMPNMVEAREDESIPPEIVEGEEGSYIKLEMTENVKDKEYIRITTFGGENKDTHKKYNNVMRGNIFVVFPKDTQANLEAVPVELIAQKNFGFKLGKEIVNAGDTKEFTLDLTKENEVTLIIPEDYTEHNMVFDTSTYTITGAKEDETIDVKTSINVEYPKLWLKGEYDQLEYPADPPATNDDTEKVRDAVAGFDTLEEITIQVSKGTTAMDVLKEYGNMFNMNITGISNGYISYMGVNPHQQIGEFDINRYSGWMYTVDEGEGWYFPNVGASGKPLNKDTTMIWHFTMAYGQDIGAPWGEPSGDPGMPCCTSTRSLNQNNLTIGDIVPQWANSNRPVEAIKQY